MGRSAEVNIMQSLKDFVLTEFQKKSNTNAFSKLENNQLPPFSMPLVSWKTTNYLPLV